MHRESSSPMHAVAAALLALGLAACASSPRVSNDGALSRDASIPGIPDARLSIDADPTAART